MHFAFAVYTALQRTLGDHCTVVSFGVVEPEAKEPREVVHVHGVVGEVAGAAHLPWAEQSYADFRCLQLAPQKVIEPAHLIMTESAHA